MRTGLLLRTSIFCSLTLVVGCGGGSNKPAAAAPTMTVVGRSGGALMSSDGNLAVDIPAGALAGDVTITTEPAMAPAEGAVGTVYEIGPTGTQFAMPVTLTLHYDAAALNGAGESSLRVATYAGGAWQLLPGATVDTQAKTVSGVTTHLSPYAIVTETAGKTCAAVQAAYGCTATGAPSGGGTSSGGTPAPSTGGTTTTCDPPTCAGATNVCGQYPGATMDSCADSATGYSAACCFADNAPICFAIGGAGGGCTSTGGGTTTCPPPPTCSSTTAATACAGYPGATLQNCTDSATGFAGACCFAPAAPVCVKTGAGRACGGSTSEGTSCPPPPRCSDGNPCAAYVGATASSCTDTADGFDATCCFATGTLPIASGGGSSTTGGADGGVPATDAGTRGGTGGSPGAGGTTVGSGGSGGTTGTMTCAPGATCTPGTKCDPGSTTSCTVCMCGADGTLSCGPCGSGTGAGGTTGAGGSGTTCAPGATCTPGTKCDPGSAAGCMTCMCGSDGTLTCMPCGGGTGAGGTTGTGATGGTATGPCQVNSMPSPDVGLPCSVIESCPDGSNYRVNCDGATGACTCFANGAPAATMPTMSCATFDPLADLVACGFPAGKI